MVTEGKDSDTITSRVSEKLENHIDRHNPHTAKPYTISLSYGITFANPQAVFSCDAMMSEADKKMYLQKKSKN